MPAQQCCAFFQIWELSGLEPQEDLAKFVKCFFGDMLEYGEFRNFFPHNLEIWGH